MNASANATAFNGTTEPSTTENPEYGSSKTENGVGLGILFTFLAVKIIFFGVVVYGCLYRRAVRQEAAAQEAEKARALANDLPPSYSNLVLNVDPPPYLDSVLNEQINPELNKSWALDLATGGVSVEVKDVIHRTRRRSLDHRIMDEDLVPVRRRRALSSPNYGIGMVSPGGAAFPMYF